MNSTKQEIENAIQGFQDEFEVKIPNILPHTQIYTIQVGGKLFRLRYKYYFMIINRLFNI